MSFNGTPLLAALAASLAAKSASSISSSVATTATSLPPGRTASSSSGDLSLDSPMTACAALTMVAVLL